MIAYKKPFFGLNSLRKVIALSGLLLVSLLNVAHADIDVDNSIDVYEYSGTQILQKIVDPVDYEVLAKQGDWSIIQFSKPTIRIWVSASYVTKNTDSVRVNTNNVNARLQPSLNSFVVTQLWQGYESQLLTERNGFYQIYLPESINCSVKTKQLSQLLPAKPSANQKWVLENTETGIGNDDNSAENIEVISDQQVEQATQNFDSGVITAIPKTNSKSVLSTSAQSTTDLTKTVNESISEAQANAPKTSSVTKKKHRVSPGDTISLLVFGEPDMSLASARVPESGEVSFPLIGSVNVNKKTTEEIESVVASLLSQGYIKNPKLSVTIDAYRPIFIKGSVNQTGAFPYSEGLSIAKALALAGGPNESANANGVSISRDGFVVVADLSLDSDYMIESGDIISVLADAFAEGKAGQYIYLHGEVNSPGAYEYRRGLTIEKAVVLAGGFSLRASRRKIAVTRVVDGQEEPVRMKRVKLYMPVEPGDIVDVGASFF